ncbi:MAG: hypothetical protein JWP94_2956 [Mucilaginibacter sp.]|nr:hypothetical protein [Mucilaginibacter sp.]
MSNENQDLLQTPVSAADDYELMSEQNDMKQHADKIILGIKTLDNSDANRSIWELFQNAVDLSERVIIEIQMTDEQFIFSHNGEPFTPLTLDCLFKQVSSKTLEEKKIEYVESDPVGQYGTGFITSHSLGKIVTIDGALAKDDWYVCLDKFKLDRNTENWKELAGWIAGLKKSVSNLLNNGTRLRPPYPQTTFTYFTSTKKNKENAVVAQESLKLILPYVMTLNKDIEKVSLIDRNGDKFIYEHGGIEEDDGLFFSQISINGQVKKIYFITSADDKVTVILPLENRQQAIDFPINLPRLFLCYPLIGSENFGINFIIHSRHFQPTEPRDGVYLASDNDSNDIEINANRKLIETATKMVFDFVGAYGEKLADSLKLAWINFITDQNESQLAEYFTTLKNQWKNRFLKFRLVDTPEGKLSPSECSFWSDELLADDSYFQPIHYFVEKYFPKSPKAGEIKDWTRIINAWDLDGPRLITVQDIADNLQKDGSINACGNRENLRAFVKYLIDQDRSSLFNTHRLLPNLKGEFRTLSGLNESINLPNTLIAIADVLMPEVSQRHIDPDFKFNLGLSPYLRKNFEADINQVAISIKDEELGSLLPDGKLAALINYCSIVTNADANNVPVQMAKTIAEYYSQDFTPLVILPIKDDEIDLRTPQRRLLRLCINDIALESPEWVETNLEILKKLIHTGAKYDTYKEYFATLPIFPNQLNELCVQSILMIDGGIPDSIIILFDKIVENDLGLKATLVNPLFSDYIANREPYTPRLAAEKIESILSGDGLYTDMNGHPFKAEILEIIKRIGSDGWGKWFQNLNTRRASVMLDMVEGDSVKDSIFAIVSLDDNKLELLGNLAKSANLEEILQLGQEAFQLLQQQNANFIHKHAIGTHIENILRSRIKNIMPDRIHAEVLNVQDGQDVIIKMDGRPVYFIEVKSRWNLTSSVRLSRNQTINAFDERHRYALCSVDMSDYREEDRYKIEDIEKIRTFIHFNEDIGSRVQQFQDILKTPLTIDEFHLDGEFRTVVPQSYIEKGNSLEQFEQMLVKTVSNLISNS